MTPLDSRLNDAARKIAKSLKFTLSDPHENEEEKCQGFLNISWKMLKDGEKAGLIRLTCRNGWDPELKLWAGRIDVLVNPSKPEYRMIHMTEGRVGQIGPYTSKGPRSCEKACKEFVRIADRFEKRKGHRLSLRKRLWPW